MSMDLNLYPGFASYLLPDLSEWPELSGFSVPSPASGESDGPPLQYSCLENPRDGGAWWAAIYGVTQSQTRLKWLSSSSTCICPVILLPGFPGGSDGKEFACNAGDLGLIPGWGRSPGGGHGNPLQYSCLENPMERGAWWATDHRVAKSRTWQKWHSIIK